MMKILTQYAVCALAVALMVPLAQAQAQPAGVQAAFGKDAGTLSDKFTALARVMSGKYDWKPGQGVRSVGGHERLRHIPGISRPCQPRCRSVG